MKVLICDDHSHVRRVLQLKLEQSGLEVRVACDGSEALALVRDFAPDVLITDITMPIVGGAELCRRLHASGDLPRRVLVVTSRTDAAARAWVAELPGVTLLEKPLSPKQVRDWVVEDADSRTEVGE